MTTDKTPEEIPEASAEATPEKPPAPPLLTLRDGLTPIVDTDAGLAEVCERIAAGSGPVAIDAERASGYRYSSRAYLIQLRREGSGTFLVDPIAFGSLPTLQEVLDGHRVDPARGHPGPALPRRGRAATDRAVRHRARRAAARLPAGRPGHPRREPARRPARQGALGGRLVDAAAARAVAGVRRPGRRGAGRAAHPDRRRAGRRGQGRVGAPGVRQPARFRAARAGGRVAPYVGAAQGPRPPRPRRGAGPVGGARRDRRAARRHAGPDHPRLRDRRGRADDADRQGRADVDQGLPRPRRRALLEPLGRRRSARSPRWTRRTCRPGRRAATARRCRAPGPRRTRSPPAGSRSPATRSSALAEEHNLPVENLLTPDYLRRTLWTPPKSRDAATLAPAVAEQLAGYGARPWQIELTTPVLVDAIIAAEVEPVIEPEPEPDHSSDDSDGLSDSGT